MCISIGVGIVKRCNRNLLSNFPELTPIFIYTLQLGAIHKFIVQQDAVIKFYDSYGGHGAHRFIGADRVEQFERLPADMINHIKHNIENHSGILVQEYLNRVDEGDKRILVCFGQSVGSFTRLPKQDSWYNLSQGGSTVLTELNDYELKLVDEVDSVMKRYGIMIYGIDTLVGGNGRRLISEFNVINVGSFAKLAKAEAML